MKTASCNVWSLTIISQESKKYVFRTVTEVILSCTVQGPWLYEFTFTFNYSLENILNLLVFQNFKLRVKGWLIYDSYATVPEYINIINFTIIF